MTYHTKVVIAAWLTALTIMGASIGLGYYLCKKYPFSYHSCNNSEKASGDKNDVGSSVAQQAVWFVVLFSGANN